MPGFEEHLNDSDDEDEGEDMDPVSSLWRCLRKGYPLMTIYNALQPEVPLEVDEATVAEKNRPKSAAFKFVQACLKDLKLPAAACFVLTDLFGDDTTGFVKVRGKIYPQNIIASRPGHPPIGSKLTRNYRLLKSSIQCLMWRNSVASCLHQRLEDLRNHLPHPAAK